MTCPGCGSTIEAGWQHCVDCGRALLAGEGAGEREHHVTVVVSDLQGSTALAEGLDPESLRHVLDQYFEQLGAVLESHGGRIEKRIGDMMVTVFGLPAPQSDDAIRAVRAVAECQQTLANLNDRLEQTRGVRLVNRTGVSTGTVVFAEAGAGHRVLAGPALVEATALEPIAPPLEALMAVPTLEALGDAIETDAVSEHTLKGGTGTIEAARLISVHGVDDDLDRPVIDNADRCLTCGGQIDVAADPAWQWCPACGSPVAVGGPRRESRRTLTIVFGDLRAIDAEPDVARQATVRCFDDLRMVLERHGATVEKYIGDAVMAVWGLEQRHEDDALRAVRAATEMQEVILRHNEQQASSSAALELRIGVNTGAVIAGDPRLGQRLVTGDAVNVAARLEQTAGLGEVVIGGLTRQLVGDGAVLEELEPLSLKGKAEPVPAFRVVEVRSRTVSRGRLELPLVGRAAELADLHAAFDDAVGRRRIRRVDVIGDAGIGKSRLVHELLDHIPADVRVLRGACLSYGEGITFWPITELIQAAAGISGTDRPDEVRASVSRLVSDDDEIARRLGSLIGANDEPYPVTELFWSVRRLLEHLGTRSPVVMVIDGLHWSEPTLRELLDHLTVSIRDTSVLLITMSRQADDMGGHPEAYQLALEPLDDREADQVMDAAVGGGTLPASLRDRIRTAAAGNPLFIEQFLTMLTDDGLLVADGDRWRVTADLEGVKVPATIEAVLSARIDALSDDERTTLEPASVIGREFARQAIDELLDAPIDTIATLESLRQRQLVVTARDPDQLVDHRFRNLLLRDVVYGGLLKRERSVLHERFADWLEGLLQLAGRGAELDEVLGYHCEQAFHLRSELMPLDDDLLALGRRASGRLAPAGERAFVRGDMPAAENLLARAAATLAADAPERPRLMLRAGEASMASGNPPEALAHFEEAEVVAGSAADIVTVAAAQLARTAVRYLTGDGVTSANLQAELDRLIPLFEQAGEHAQLARCRVLDAQTHLMHCHWTATEQALQTGIDHARRAGDHAFEKRNLPTLALAAAKGSRPATEAIARCNEILPLVSSDQRARSMVEPYLAYLMALDDHRDEARMLFSKARSTFDDLGCRFDAVLVDLDHGSTELMVGSPVDAERVLRRAYDELQEMGEQNFISTVAAYLAEAVRQQGRVEEAHELADEAARVAADDDVITQAIVRLVRAKLAMMNTSYDLAEAFARSAIALMADTDEIVTQADAMLDLAAVLAAKQDPDGAATAASEALDLYRKKGSRPGERRAHALLRSLGRDGTAAPITD